MSYFLDLTTGLPTLWAKIKAIVPQQEDDIDVLNLLSEFGYSTPLSDADDYIISDSDNNIILG